MFRKGSTATDGLRGSAPAAAGVMGTAGPGAGTTRWTRTGRSMFFSICGPRSSKARSSLLATCSRTVSETTTPPGVANASRRAATLTPSPYTSSASTMTSPRWTAIRKLMRWGSSRLAFRCAMASCTKTAQRTASTTLANSTMAPSPISLMIRPPCSARSGSIWLRRACCSRSSVPASSTPISLDSPRRRPRESRTACVASSTSRPGRGSSANVRKLPDTFGQYHAERGALPEAERRPRPRAAPYRPQAAQSLYAGRVRLAARAAGGRRRSRCVGGAIGAQTLDPNRRIHGAARCHCREQCRCNGLLANGKWRNRVLTRAQVRGPAGR